MYLVQVLLPLYDNTGRRLPPALHQTVRDELAARFGGLTAHTRAPAEGLWVTDSARVQRDEIVIYEVMTTHLDADWWRDYRVALEGRFAQQSVVVRSQWIRRH